MVSKNSLSQSLSIYQPMKYWWVYFMISLAVILPGVYSLVRYGLKQGIDFTGGTTIAWQSSKLTEDAIRQNADKEQVKIVDMKHAGDTWTLTTSPIDRTVYQKYAADIKATTDLKELTFDTIGPSLGKELLRKTMYGLIMAASLIMLYVAYRFQDFRFGMSAILAMLHDLLVVLGTFSLLGHFAGVEVDTLFVTALLTILSFSVHDTIVVYDRIRELRKKHGGMDFQDLTNRAVVETLGRSTNNSMTVIFMLLAMFLMGGESTKWFIFALLIGTISGTYSSPFTAVPILLVWERISHAFKKRKYDKRGK
jgi:preprotein translocase subunit SecF